MFNSIFSIFICSLRIDFDLEQLQQQQKITNKQKKDHREVW